MPCLGVPWLDNLLDQLWSDKVCKGLVDHCQLLPFNFGKISWIKFDQLSATCYKIWKNSMPRPRQSVWSSGLASLGQSLWALPSQRCNFFRWNNLGLFFMKEVLILWAWWKQLSWLLLSILQVPALSTCYITKTWQVAYLWKELSKCSSRM